VCQLSDVIENIDLERFIDITTYNVPVDNLPTCVSFDDTCNQFGNKLLNLCKENSIFIINSRSEPAMYTCYKFNRTRLMTSVVDYVSVNCDLCKCIDEFKVNKNKNMVGYTGVIRQSACWLWLVSQTSATVFRFITLKCVCHFQYRVLYSH